MMNEGPSESRPVPRRGAAFAELAASVRRAVDARLQERLDSAVAAAGAHDADVVAAIDAVRSLTMRGGKRLRAVLMAAAFEACGGGWPSEAVVLAGVAVELLQAYLLIHDDWMDNDLVRRGGPSVHAMLRGAWGDPHMGDAGAILAGDFASALAQEALAAMPVEPGRTVDVLRVYAQVQREVITGQILDMRGAGRVEVMHDLKTGSYTVRGPLSMGAVLAGATPEQRAALDRFAAPLGVAFQLRDDLLGTFGDPRSTGKPAGGDLRSGKRTALVDALREAKDAEGERLLAKVKSGGDQATDADVSALVVHLAATARPRVEARLKELLAEAERVLASAPFAARGRSALEGAVAALGERES